MAYGEPADLSAPYICVKALDDTLPLPSRGTAHSAGYDLSASVKKDIFINPGQMLAIPTGFAWQIPEWMVGLIRPRSGLTFKHRIDTRAGVIDSDYRGEIIVPIVNEGHRTFVINHGMRIAQMVIVPHISYNIKQSTILDDSERDTDGFGSTGN